jgi:malonate decarboxylase epsilon subunit
MLHRLLDHSAVVRTLDEISEVLHSDVRDLDSEQSLHSDVSVQLALFAARIATARALTEQDIRPAAVSGLSVGAFGAAVAAEVLPLRDAVELVSKATRGADDALVSDWLRSLRDRGAE